MKRKIIFNNKGIIFTILLSSFFFQNNISIYPQDKDYSKELELIKIEYHSKNYVSVIKNLEKFLNEVSGEKRTIRGKFFLLLGAAYEQTGFKEKAIENYLLGDMLVDYQTIKNVDFSSLELFTKNVLGKTINGKRLIEKVGKRKKKKKFPYLKILGVVAVITTIIFLMKRKSEGKDEKQFKMLVKEVIDSIEWIEIPAGEFLMGDGFGLGSEDELPVHKVYLDSYKISKYEITYDQFNKLESVKKTPLSHLGEGVNHPVINVSYEQAALFCEWLSNNSDTNIKLPTEAQWEKAAIGSSITIYPWGNDAPDCNRTNFNNCSGRTQKVGSFLLDISEYGVMDMAGNVSEMIYDVYQADFYSISPLTNPTGPEYFREANKVLRGGNFSSSDIRITKRSSLKAFEKNDKTGFRVVWIN